MLTSNVGYLAIQSVDLNDGAARSPGQIASYLSVVANIGSIILGLLLMRQNRTKMDDTAEKLVSSLHSLQPQSLIDPFSDSKISYRKKTTGGWAWRH